MVTLETLAAAGWQWPAQAVAELDAYDKKFVEFEFLPPRTLAYYRRRIDYLGLSDAGRVLDAGCGMGQWSIALSHTNHSVEGIDANVRRIRFAETIAANMGAQNCAFRIGMLEALPYPDESFDAVFCYGVFMFTRMPATLREFCRVLKRGGRFYLNANTWGWYAHLLRDVSWNRIPALRCIRNTLLGHEQSIVVSEPWLRRRLAAAGLTVLQLDVEGMTSFRQPPPGDRPAPGYPSRYMGLRAILEAIGTRP